jgi:two-component system OmpR family sensor kinase
MGLLSHARALPAAVDSLAGRLARTLILSVGGVWLVCVLGVVWYIDREINYNFDNELVEVAHRMFDIAIEQYDAMSKGQEPLQPLIAPPPLFIEDEVIYQIVNGGTRVLQRSSNARPDIFDVPLAPGFSNNRPDWRIYTVHHPTRDMYMQVADPIEERRHAVNRTLLGLIVAMGAVLPLLALVLRQIARRELRVLQRLAGEISVRSSADLRPINLPGLPHELRSVADDVNRLLERLAHALDVERALAANAAHELRTPLAAARLRLQTALEHDLARSDVEAALQALQTLSHRTEKLLQLSRAESGASLARTPVDLVRLAGTVAEEFWQDTHSANRLHLNVPDEAAPLARGDVDALAIALRNLIENALRYSRGGRVELAVELPCTLIVRDDGPGVTAEQLQTLRQRHVRHGDDRAGYGLGLSIVSTIVQQHEAALELRSPPAGARSGFEARIVLQPS